MPRWAAALLLVLFVLLFAGCFYLIGQRFAMPGLALGTGLVVLVVGVLHWLGVPLYEYFSLAIFGLADEIRYQESAAAIARMRRQTRGERERQMTPEQLRRAMRNGGLLAVSGTLLFGAGALAMLGMIALSAGPFALFLAPIIAVPLASFFDWLVNSNRDAARNMHNDRRVRELVRQESSQRFRWDDRGAAESGQYDPAVELPLQRRELDAAEAVAREKLQLAREAGHDERAGMYQRYLDKIEEIRRPWP